MRRQAQGELAASGMSHRREPSHVQLESGVFLENELIRRPDVGKRTGPSATVIANAVDLPGHPAIVRCPAHDLQPDSDLGARLVTRDVGELTGHEVEDALECGAACARKLLAAGLIDGAALRLQGETVLVSARAIGTLQLGTPVHRGAMESAMHV